MKYNNRPLTHKQKRFLELYLISDNAREAAEKAGYSRRTATHKVNQLTENPRIMAAMAAKCRKVSAKNDITLAEVVKNARHLVKMGVEGRVNDDEKRVYDLKALAVGNDQLIRLAGLYAPEKREVKFDLSDKTEPELRRELVEKRSQAIDVEVVEACPQ